eukprot:TRINITY_DN49107_c0_g1_i1.p1 TRINITY_DN49107_c0_g1~~TRINITY_DN49107_c0_g1_i1.p1  ORF type:complete len:656 (+),score=138.98 TRINITY_DN49107_c0_g1_i1:182-2149(+)
MSLHLSPDGATQAAKPDAIDDLRQLKSDTWKTVVNNLSLTRGRSVKDLSKPCGQSVLVAPADLAGLHDLVAPAPSAWQVQTEVCYNEDWQTSLTVTQLSMLADLPIQEIDAIASMRFKSVKESYSVNSSYNLIRKVSFPIGSFGLRLNRSIRHPDREPRAGQVQFEVNPDFIEDVREVVDSVKDMPGSAMWRKEKLRIKLEEDIFADYGHLLPVTFAFGVGLYDYCHKKTAKTATSLELASQARADLETSLFSAGGGYSAKASKTSLNINAEVVQGFSAIAGPVRSKDAIHTSQANPPDWRVISIDKVVTVLDLLPKELMKEILAINADAEDDVNRALKEAEEQEVINGTDVIDYDAAVFHQKVAGVGGASSEVASTAVVAALEGYKTYAENMKVAAEIFQKTGASAGGFAQAGALVEATGSMTSASTAAMGCAVSAVFATVETCYLYHQWGQGAITAAEFKRGATGAFAGALGGTVGGLAGAKGGALLGACIGGVIGGPPGAALGGLIGCGTGLVGGSVAGNIFGRKAGSYAYSSLAGDNDTEQNISLVLNAMKVLDLMHKDPENITEEDVKERFKIAVLKSHPDKVVMQATETEEEYLKRKDLKKAETCLVVHSRNVLESYIQNRKASHWMKVKATLKEMWQRASSPATFALK